MKIIENQCDSLIIPLNEHVSESLEKYFKDLEGYKITNLYKLVMSEVEIPLLKLVMKNTKNNQTNAASILGVNRGTLRKKLKYYKII